MADFRDNDSKALISKMDGEEYVEGIYVPKGERFRMPTEIADRLVKAGAAEEAPAEDDNEDALKPKSDKRSK